MSPQEAQALQNFLNQLVQVRGIVKDPQADALISSAVGQQPDAAYLLVQRALLVEQALNAAKTQIASLQNQLLAAQPAPSHSFLDAEAWGNTPSLASRPVSAPMPAGPMQSQGPAASAGFFGGGLGSTLGTVAATAAGMAGGAFLFQGLEHLMHPNGGAGGFLSQAGMTPPVENTTVDNDYPADAATDGQPGAADIASDDGSWDDGSSVI